MPEPVQHETVPAADYDRVDAVIEYLRAAGHPKPGASPYINPDADVIDGSLSNAVSQILDAARAIGLAR